MVSRLFAHHLEQAIPDFRVASLGDGRIYSLKRP
jgi:hypothetical protein